MAFLRTFAVFVALSVSAHAAVGPVTDLHITNAIVSPDGFSRPAVVAGGTFPGPVIKGNKGDNFQITVVNELTDPKMLTDTSIHWHGFFQKGTNWADGPAFVTQCPIISGNSFNYDFNAQDQTGTFWYHSHLSTQYCDGLRGAFVVYDPNDPHASLYDVDDDSTVITLADWYHTLAQDENLSKPVVADATLINGLGRSFVNTTPTELAVIGVQPGKRYRMRLVSTSCDPNYAFSIDNHDMKIIEVDSVSSQPHTVDQIQIFAGQRYSFVLNANQPVGNYWIRALPGGSNFAGGINSAILRYEGAPVEEPTSQPPATFNKLVETDLHPLEDLGVPGNPVRGGADVPHVIKVGRANNRFNINGVSFEPPSAPVLLQILSGHKQAQELLPEGSIIPLPPNKTVELSFPGGGQHPFHLHGHNFAVVQSAGNLTQNYVNPIWRDVVSIGNPGDNVTIRFNTDNPGPWFLHCHIDWHLEVGLAVVFAEDVPGTKSANPVPPAWDELCPAYNKAHNISTAY
uniref:laccase n=1 Tax=Metuloidea murashkinskyi TaxID=2721089 RepID=A0A3G3M2H4_9APHY|nr:laccase 4 [Steccherinum murashkinskyi]